MKGRGPRHVLDAWILGQRYDPELVVSTGLADHEAVVDAERATRTWLR